MSLPTLHLLVTVILLFLLDMFLVDLPSFFLDGELVLHVLDTDRHLLFRTTAALQGLSRVLFGMFSKAHRGTHFVLGTTGMLFLPGLRRRASLLIVRHDCLYAFFLFF